MSVKHYNTKLRVNEVEIKFSKKKLTAYGGFSLFASFFQIIRLKEFFESISLFACRSNNSISVYAKAVSYFTVVIAGGKRFAHLLYLNSADIFEELFTAEHIVIRQNKHIREKAMGKTLNLFPVETEKYRYSVWLTNSDASPYEVWKEARPRSNDENTIKELKESFALGGFSMKNFYAVEAAMNFRILMYNLFYCLSKMC